MAIVSMKKLTLVGLNSERDAILKRLQALGCVQIIETESAPETSGDTNISRLAEAVSTLSQYQKKPAFGKRPEVPVEELQKPPADSARVYETVQTLEKLQDRARDIKSNIIRLNGTISQLAPWERLDIPLESVANTRETWMAIGIISAREYGSLLEKTAEFMCEIMEVSREGDAAHVLVLAHKADIESVSPLLAEAGFSRVELKFTGTAAENIKRCKKETADFESELKSQEKSIAGMKDELSRIELAHDHSVLARDRNETVKSMTLTETAFLLYGWVPEPNMVDVEKAVSTVTGDYHINFDEPAEDDKIPTLLSNNRVISNFETITDMYSPPDARGFDPNSIMAPFYACFFGMMVSDAAYGIVLMIAALVMLKLYTFRGQMKKILGVVVMGGLATLIWGALFGGWFGMTADIKWFSPMDDPIMMLILCYTLGAVHIITGMGINAYLSLKAGKWQDAVFDQIAWIALILGLPCIVLEPVRILGIILAIGGAATVLLFAGREKSNVVGRLVGGLGALYGVTGYLSDVLSYSRLFAMGLATGVIGMVFNTLAGMIGGNPIGMAFAVLVLIVGHVFNLAINTLGAYVHSCRLQYIEFYGKFYASGGVPFKPLRARTSYVDVKREI